MKQLHYILLAVLLLFSCQAPDNGGSTEVTLSLNPTELLFGSDDATTKFVSVTTSASWTAEANQTWVHLQNASGTGNGSFSVNVDAFAGDNERTALINVSAGDKSARVLLTQGAAAGKLVPAPAAFDGNKRSNTAYQLLIYSFADSDGDGVGDFKGIQNKLDYLDAMGVTALWLSPAHPASSYHAYDITDYYSLNPAYGTEQDFKNLLDAAHAKGIAIYMDYVLNHSSKFHPWFQEALSNPDSKYRDYYFLSANPQSDYSKFPMLKGTTYQSGEWKAVTSGSPKLTITSTTEAVTNGNASWNLWVWQDGGEGKVVKFVDKGDGTYYLVMEINGKWGILVRKYPNWDAGSKFGAKTATTIQAGTPVDLVADGADMSFTGNGRYKIELTNVSTQTLYYMGCFSDWMPDLNYGDVSTAETNACFLDLAASADKWINMGVDGLRLDAVKHICGGIGSFNHTNNRTLLKKWYDHCNATYKAAGHSGNIFMVAEEWDSHDTETTYYKSLTSCFEFDYGYKLRDALNGANASGFAAAVSKFVTDHTAQRADAVSSFFLSNHDQDRFGSNVNRKAEREKQAAAILLSGPGKPFIYQGEELGYWGTKERGDANVRQPIAWDASLKDLAKLGLDMGKSDQVNYEIVKGDISVEKQQADAGSILNVYRTWGQLRSTYPALGSGTMTPLNLGGSAIAAWYMSAGSEKLLVVHNVALTVKEVTVTDSMEHPVALLGSASVAGNTLALGPNSSVVFQL
jgi:glycosidase